MNFFASGAIYAQFAPTNTAGHFLPVTFENYESRTAAYRSESCVDRSEEGVACIGPGRNLTAAVA